MTKKIGHRQINLIFSSINISGKKCNLNFHKETPNFVGYFIIVIFPEICFNFGLEIFKYYKETRFNRNSV
jgi:hypothetical protein